MKNIKITLLLFLLNSFTVFSQFNFQRSWGTYFGDERFKIADSKIDSDGNLYIVGSFYGNDITSLYPFTNSTSFQQFYGGGDYDGFIVKFDSQGNIAWGTYLGGLSDDKINAIDIDINNNLYIIGTTLSNTNIATVGSFQENIAGSSDSFISKFTPAGTLVWSTYFGSSDVEEGINISFDGFNHIYISCDSNSTDLATSGVFQELKGSATSMIAKFDLNGNRIWATYFGIARGIFDIKANGNSVYVTGTTSDCPPYGSYNTYYGTSNGFKPLPSNCREIYFSKFNTLGQREWSTYYGGNQNEATFKNSIDLKDDKIYFSGTSPNYTNQEVATINTYQSNSIGSSNFITQFNQDGTRNWGTYNGGYSGSSNVFSWSCVTTEKNSNTFYNYGSTGMDNNITTSDGYLTTTNNQYSSDAFICKFSDQNTKSWGTYYGGELEERDIDFHPYNDGNKFYIVGSTQSLTQIATTNGYQSTKQVFDLVNNTYQSAYTIFIAHFEPNPLSNESFSDTSIIIYPNPANNFITIKNNNTTSENFTYKIIDITGRCVKTGISKFNENIYMDSFSSGVYSLQIETANGNKVVKKVVKN
jgi:hypothetical protein